VQFAIDHPQFAPPQSNIARLKGPMESAYFAAEVARVQLALAKKGGSQGQLSVAYAQIVQARAVLSQTMASPPALQIEQAEQAVRQAATTLQVARLRLAQTVITAPYAGIVASVNIKVSEPAGPGAPALVLIDDSRFHLDVTVDEVDVAQLKVGQGVSITIEALPGVALDGRVGQLAPIATVQGGLVNYTVRLLLDSTSAPVRTGMSATAQVVVAEVHDVVLVPNWAIRRDRRTGQVYASLERNEALVEVPIVSGLRGESYTEARSGVGAGDVAAISTQRQTIDLLGGGP
jgi:HlyD family secretion protein